MNNIHTPPHIVRLVGEGRLLADEVSWLERRLANARAAAKAKSDEIERAWQEHLSGAGARMSPVAAQHVGASTQTA